MAHNTAGHQRDFAWYWTGQSASVLSNQVVTFLLPTIAILLFNAFAWIPIAALAGVLDLIDLFAVALIGGVCGVLFDVASQSHLPTLVPRHELARANSRIELSTSLAMMLGPVLGGALVQLVTGVTAMAVAAALLIMSVFGVVLLRRREPLALPRKQGVTRDIAEGVATLFRHPVLRRTTIAGAVRNLGNSAAGTVGLVFAYQVLMLSPGTVGLPLTVSGIVSILGAWLSPRMLTRFGTWRTLRFACVSGVAWVAAPLALWLPAIPSYLAVAVVAAFWLPVWNTTITTVRQTVTAPELLGRVHATSRAINFCALPLGALLGGAGADASSSAFGAAGGVSAALALVSVPAGGDVPGGDRTDGQQSQAEREEADHRPE